jgi:hypothetical protein
VASRAERRRALLWPVARVTEGGRSRVGEVTGRRGFGRALFSGWGGTMWSHSRGRRLPAEGPHAAGRTTTQLSHQKNVHSLVFLVVCIGDRRYRPSV